MRRGEFSQNKRNLMKKIDNEYQLFKYQLLSKSNIEIYDSCNTISFYSCIHEYFMYAEEIENSYLSACLKCENIIATLHGLYLEYEYLRYNRWEDIEEILNVLVREQENL